MTVSEIIGIFVRIHCFIAGVVRDVTGVSRMFESTGCPEGPAVCICDKCLMTNTMSDLIFLMDNFVLSLGLAWA